MLLAAATAVILLPMQPGLSTEAQAAPAPLLTASPQTLSVSAPIGDPAVGRVVVRANQRVSYVIENDNVGGMGLPTSYDTQTVASGPAACSVTWNEAPGILEQGDECVYTVTQTANEYIGQRAVGAIRYHAFQLDDAGAQVNPEAEEVGTIRVNTYSNPFSVTPLDFGSVQLGASATGSVTVKNESRRERYFETDLAVPYSGPFRVVAPPGTRGERITLAPGATAEVQVTFTPETVGPVEDMFVPAFLLMNRQGMVKNPFLVLRGIGTAPTAGLAVTNPQDVSITEGEQARFVSTASSTAGANSMQWQVLAPGATEWVDVSGATSAELQLADVASSADGSQYRAVWTNDAFGEQVVSAPATLRVTEKAVAPIVPGKPPVDTGKPPIDTGKPPVGKTPERHDALPATGGEVSQLPFFAASTVLVGFGGLVLARRQRTRRP